MYNYYVVFLIDIYFNRRIKRTILINFDIDIGSLRCQNLNNLVQITIQTTKRLQIGIVEN